jgi:SlyX protein
MAVTDRNEIELIKAQLIELQSQLAFQEDTIQALNDVVTRQQQQIENLNEIGKQHKSQLEGLVSEQGGDTTEPKPPHY